MPNSITNPFAALLARSRGRAANGEPVAEAAPAVAPPQAVSAVPAPHAAPPAAEQATTEIAAAVAEGPLGAADVAAEELVPAGFTRMHILVSAGSGQADRILAGTVGTVDTQGVFTIDPDYRSLAYLFTLASGAGVPGAALDENVTTSIIVRDDLVQVVKANLIESASRNWSQLYDSMSSYMPGGALARNMLEQEKANVQRSVDAYLQAKALPKWDVPVNYRAMVYEEDPANRPSDVAGLLAIAHRYDHFTAVTSIDAQLPVMPYVEPDQRPAAEPEQLPQEWATHVGELDLHLGGAIAVRAPDAQSAGEVARALLEAAAGRVQHLHQFLTPEARRIHTAELRAPTDDDSFDDDAYERDVG